MRVVVCAPLLISILLLSGCGQKGDLFLPEHADEVEGRRVLNDSPPAMTAWSASPA